MGISLPGGRIVVRKVFVTGAIRIFPESVKARMKGIHETIEEVCKKKGIETFVPFLLGKEEQHPQEMAACDLVIAERTFKEPRLDVQIGTAKSLGKPILFVYEETSLESRLRWQDEDVRWKIEYRRYHDLSRLLADWFDEYAISLVSRAS